MNNEKLVKDDMILQVVKHFEMKFGKQSFRIKDYWDADLFAIGLSDSFKYLLYFSTWRQKDNKFYVAVETENISGHEPGELVEEFENVILYELEDIFMKYFNPKTVQSEEYN